MARLAFATSSYQRFDGLLPAARLVNMYAEQAPTSPGGTILVPRMGLEQQYSLGGQPRGIYRADGVVDGAVMAVAGSKLYRDQTLVGDIGDDGRRVEWAFTVDGLFVLSDGVVWQYDGDLTATTFPDEADVASISDLNNVLVAVRADTGTVYFRLAGDTTWNPLDFFSAEREPDPAICVRALADLLFVFGSSSVEAFSPTGDAETPFVRVDGLSITRGCKDRDSVVRADNTLVFISETNSVFRIEGTAVKVSDNGIDGRIQESNSASAWTYTDAGHEFYVVNLDEETLALDLSTGQWHQPIWDVSVGWDDGQRVWVGSGEAIHLLEDRSDDNGAPIERLFTALAPTENVGSCDCIQVNVTVGTADVNSEPGILSMRWSDNEGRTWSDWKEAQAGFWGEFRRRVRYRRLGMIDAPGRVFEFRFTDPVKVAFTGVEMNPPLGGRARG